MRGESRRAVRRRPVVLALALAVLPGLVVVLGLLVQLGPGTFADLFLRPAPQAGASPRGALVRSLLAPSVLLAAFVWLTAGIADSPLLRKRRIRTRRGAVALGCLLMAATLWFGIILGDVTWRSALPQAPASPTLLIPLWVYLLTIPATAGLFYLLLRP